MLLNAPCQFSKTPSDLCIFFFGSDARHASIDREITNWVDDRRQSDVECQVGRRKDSNRVLVISRADGTVDDDWADVLGNFAIDGLGASDQLVIDAGNMSVGCGGEVARHEVAEREVMAAG